MKNQRTQKKFQGSLTPGIRQDLVTKLDHLFELVPETNMDFDQALVSNLITEPELASFYEAFTKFLTEEESSERILLYFPIELIPRNNPEFRKIYLEMWRKLLLQHDLLANFVDGDIPEVEMRTGPLPMVVKAVHLIPSLIQKGLLSIQDVLELKSKTSDVLLAKDLEEVLCLPSKETGAETQCPQSAPIQNAVDVKSRVGKTREAIESLKNYCANHGTDKPASRMRWEIKRSEQMLIDECATEIAAGMINLTISDKDFVDSIRRDQNQEDVLVEIISAGKALETINQTDPKRAREIYLAIESVMDELWEKSNDVAREILEGIWSRLAVLGIVERKHLDKLGIKTPKFDQEMLSKDEELLAPFEKIALAIRTSDELGRFLFPLTIAYGSRVKGYGTQNADIDIAVLIKPTIDFSAREQIQKLLEKTLVPLGVKGKALEFWTEMIPKGLKIRDFIDPDRSLGDSTLAYIPFGGVWIGDENVVEDLYEKILAGYLQSKDKKIFGKPAREVWLREMERDALQYRLMHKGYHHFYPKQMTANLPVEMVNSNGAFWDSGFRRVATKLFLKKVFLPHT
ncbi:MAG: nucleotidyltransferase domain-containing protein [bacterium]